MLAKHVALSTVSDALRDFGVTTYHNSPNETSTSVVSVGQILRVSANGFLGDKIMMKTLAGCLGERYVVKSFFRSVGSLLVHHVELWSPGTSNEKEVGRYCEIKNRKSAKDKRAAVKVNKTLIFFPRSPLAKAAVESGSYKKCWCTTITENCAVQTSK